MSECGELLRLQIDHRALPVREVCTCDAARPRCHSVASDRFLMEAGYDGSPKKPQYVGHLTNDLIYSHLAPGVLE